MRALPAILIYLSFLIAEIHNLFEGSNATITPSLTGSVEMPIFWAVKFFSNQIVWIMICVAMYYMNTLRINRNAVKVLLSWSILDTLLFIINYKTLGYGGTYLILAILIIWFNVDKGKLFNWIQGK